MQPQAHPLGFSLALFKTRLVRVGQAHDLTMFCCRRVAVEIARVWKARRPAELGAHASRLISFSTFTCPSPISTSTCFVPFEKTLCAHGDYRYSRQGPKGEKGSIHKASESKLALETTRRVCGSVLEPSFRYKIHTRVYLKTDAWIYTSNP